MNYRGTTGKNYVCFLDLRRATWPWPYDYNYKPPNFIEDQQNQLPVLMKVTDGYYGTNSINFTYSSEDIYLITHIMTQKRIIIKDRTGQLLSFPEDHSMPFYAVVDGKEEETQQQLGQIVEQHAMSAAKIQVKPVSGKSISFCRGAGEKHSMLMDIFDWETTYDERYLVANSVAYERMSTVPTVIPIWMPISLTSATGFSDGTFEDYRKFMDEMRLATKNFQNSKVTGIKDIMLFEGKLSDYEEGTYDTIAPFDYGSIGQFSRPPRAVTSSTPPARAPPTPPLHHSVSDGGGKSGPKPPASTPKKSMFSLFKSKSTGSTPEHRYEQNVSNQKADQVQPYMALQLGGTEQSENIYMEAPETGENQSEDQRSLPPIPADEQRRQKSKFRSGGKAVQTISKPPPNKVTYEPVQIGTDKRETPALVKPEKPSVTKLVSSNSQEGGSVYGDYSDLPQSIEGMSVGEISECLAVLKMTRHVDKFIEFDVDGSLLNALSREILLEEFNFTEFEVTKLMKFKRGWRPKTRVTTPHEVT